MTAVVCDVMQIEVCMISLGSDEKMQELDKVIKEHRPK